MPGGQLTIINDPPNSLPVDSTSFSLSTSHIPPSFPHLMHPSPKQINSQLTLRNTATPLYSPSSNACSKTTYPVGDTSSLCSGSGTGNNPPSSSSSASAPASSSLIISPPVISPTSTGGMTPTTLATSVSATASASQGCTWEGHCLGMFWIFFVGSLFGGVWVCLMFWDLREREGW